MANGSDKSGKKVKTLKKSGGKVEKVDLAGFKPVVDKTPVFLIFVV